MTYLPTINHPSEDDPRTAYLRRGVKKMQEMLRPSTSYWRMKVIRADAYATARTLCRDLSLDIPESEQHTADFLRLVLDEIGVRHS